MIRKWSWVVMLVLVAGCAPKEKTLHLFNWDNYMNPDVLADFLKETGVRVIEEKFASNEELIAKLQAGGAGYDIVVPSDYAVRLLVNQKLLATLDVARLPNLRNLGPRFSKPAYDPQHAWSVPYIWGTTGIAYNRKITAANPPQGWDDVFNPAKLKRYKRRVSMLNDMRETIGAALIYKGYSPNSTDPAALQQAKQVLLAQKPFLAKYDSEAYEDSLVAEETVLGHGWVGEIFVAQKSNADIGFLLPKEGSFMFVDNLAIPAASPNKALAEQFINYLLRPDVAAKNANFLRYPTPNALAKPLLDPGVEGANYTLPPNATLYSIEDLDERTGKLYEEVWTQVKAQ